MKDKITLKGNRVYCGNRFIGTLEGNKLIVYRDRGKHLMRNINCYGFNFDVVFKSTTLEKIELHENGNVYLIPLSVIKEGKPGKYNDFEKQVFVSLTKINKYKI